MAQHAQHDLDWQLRQPPAATAAAAVKEAAPALLLAPHRLIIALHFRLLRKKWIDNPNELN
jgi:hypothetical protein